MSEDGEVPLGEDTVAIHTDNKPSDEEEGVARGDPETPPIYMGMPFLRTLVLGASFVICFFAMLNCPQGCNGEEAYALSVGVISFVVVAVFMFLDRKGKMEDKHSTMVTISLVLWWTVATLYLTNFSHEYIQVGNPWFACWVAFFASLLMAMNDIDHLKNRFQKMTPETDAHRQLSLLLVFSGIELFSALGPCGQICTGWNRWAVIVGCISIALAALVKLSPDVQKKGKYVGYVLFGLWIGGALVTFKGPFMMAGNGYISVWACLFISLLYLLGQLPQDANN